MKLNTKTYFNLNVFVKALQFILLIFLMLYTYNLQRQVNKLNKKLTAVTANTPAEPTVKLNTDSRSPFMGTNTAPVEMTIFSDFECEFCKTFAREVFPRIKSDYVDKGLLKVYFRFLPLDIHKDAFKAAEAAAYVNSQGKFWQMHDFLFDNQHALNDNLLFNWTVNKQLDSAKFKTHLQNHTYKKQIEDDVSEAHRVGITVTPTIVVNGKINLGAKSYDYFSALIDKELANIKTPPATAESCN